MCWFSSDWFKLLLYFDTFGNTFSFFTSLTIQFDVPWQTQLFGGQRDNGAIESFSALALNKTAGLPLNEARPLFLKSTVRSAHPVKKMCDWQGARASGWAVQLTWICFLTSFRSLRLAYKIATQINNKIRIEFCISLTCVHLRTLSSAFQATLRQWILPCFGQELTSDNLPRWHRHDQQRAQHVAGGKRHEKIVKTWF